MHAGHPSTTIFLLAVRQISSSNNKCFDSLVVLIDHLGEFAG